MLCIQCFEIVVIRFVWTLFINETLKNFFIQGFAKLEIIKEIFHACPKDLIAAKYVAKKVEQINKVYERLQHKENYNILSFISIYAKVSYVSSSLIHEQLSLIPTNIRVYLLSLNIRPLLLSMILIYLIEDNR